MSPDPGIPVDYLESILAWRREKDASLLAQRGWLSLDGLYWLEPGRNTFGAGEANAIVLARGAQYAGTLEISNGEVFLHPAPNSGLTINECPAVGSPLHLDVSGDPSIIVMDGLEMIVIRRGQRFALRVWNPSRLQDHAFTGRQWYPVNPAWRVSAAFNPSVRSETITVPDVTGVLQSMQTAGQLEFSLATRPCSLLAIDEGDGDLFVIFRDLTSGVTTYPAGRYLYAKAGSGSAVILDFNQAYNPPCAFTEYATCPLPPPGNRLAVEIKAGELLPPPQD